MEGRKQAMSLAFGAIVKSRPGVRGLPLAALPTRFGRTQIRINRCAFFRSRLCFG
jgi:hypothetical protein